MKGKVVGWGIGIAVVAALATTGTVYAANNSVETAAPTASPHVLVPLTEQPRTSAATGPLSLKDALGAGAFSLPKELAIEPASCFSYLEDAIGPLETLDGSVQQGQRATGGAFLQAVIQVPGKNAGELMAQIEASATACKDGSLTLTDPRSGDVLKGTVSFVKRDLTAGLQEISGFGGDWVASWEQAAVAENGRVTQLSFAADDQTLIFAMEEGGTLGITDEIAVKMFERLQTGG